MAGIGGSIMNKAKNGFTLIELMIVVAIVGILAAIAYPSYLAQIHQSRRATGIQSVLECAAVLERRYTLNRTYTEGACEDIDNDDYKITVTISGLSRTNRACTSNDNENCFLITASSSVSSDTDCKTMKYNELGIKTAYDSNGSPNTQTCWRST